MGPSCEVLLESDAPHVLDAIDAVLAGLAERIERTRKGRVWDVWVRGRPVHVEVRNSSHSDEGGAEFSGARRPFRGMQCRPGLRGIARARGRAGRATGRGSFRAEQVMAELITLMSDFARMGEATVGRGPDHPTDPNPAVEPPLGEFLRQFPALLQSPDYIAFLRQYGGAMLLVPDSTNDRWMVTLPGFWEAENDLVAWNEEGFVGPDADGFLLFAQLFHQVSKTEMEFGFFIRAEQRPGVYQTIYRAERASESAELAGKGPRRKWYCASFTEWLARLVHLGEALFEERPE